MTFIVFRPTARPLAVSISASIAVAFAGMPAQAQESSDRNTNRVLVTATRFPQIASEALSDNIVITSEDIARSGQTSLVELLQRQRGIEVARNGGPGTNASVFIRGTDNRQNVVLVDGVRVGSSTAGGASWSAIPLSQIDHIEIVYGPLSSLYGADALGGVVQIFTKQGSGPASPTVAVGVGSYRERNLEAGVSGSAGEGSVLRYALSTSHDEAAGFSATKPGAFGFNPDRDGYKHDSVSGRLGVEWAKGQEAGLVFLKSRLDAQFDTDPAFDDRNIQNLETFALYSKNRLAQNWTSKLQLSTSADKLDSVTAFGTSFFNTRQNGLSWQNDIVLGSELLQLLAERREEKADTDTPELNRTRTTNAFAAAYQLKRGPHLAIASLRNDDSSQFGSHTTGNLAYGYRISNALRINASAGTSFRAPTFNELYYPGFGIPTNRPEKGRNAEAGVYYDNGKAQLSAVVYRNRVTDLIINTEVCPVDQATHPFGCAYNVNKALLTGVTLGASTSIGNYVARASLDMQDPRDETTDRTLARRARQHGTVGLDYVAGPLHAGGEVVFSGKRYDDPANTNVLGGYALLNLSASYDFAPNWSLFGRWNNVLDKNYELVGNYATAGSNLFVGVRYGIR